MAEEERSAVSAGYSARITLFNARCSGESAWLKVSHWMDASNVLLFNKNRIAALPAEQQEYFKNTRIMYQTGKSVNHFFVRLKLKSLCLV